MFSDAKSDALISSRDHNNNNKPSPPTQWYSACRSLADIYHMLERVSAAFSSASLLLTIQKRCCAMKSNLVMQLKEARQLIITLTEATEKSPTGRGFVLGPSDEWDRILVEVENEALREQWRRGRHRRRERSCTRECWRCSCQRPKQRHGRQTWRLRPSDQWCQSRSRWRPWRCWRRA